MMNMMPWSSTARLRLPGDTVDGCVAGQTVADGGADGATSEGQAEGDHRG